MKARLQTLMTQTHQELASYGDTSLMGESHRGTLVLKLMTQFARDFVNSVDGKTFEASTKELCGGARIYYVFTDVFGHALQGINPTENLTTQDIRTAIRNSTGPRPSLFVPEQAFELLIKPQLKLLEPPSLRCVELVYEELMKICHNCTSMELQRFPRLHAQIIEVVSDLLRERLGPTSDYVQSLIQIQAAYINTNHPAFVQDSANIARQTREGHQRQSAPMIKSASGSGRRGSTSSDGFDGARVVEEDEDHRAHKETSRSHNSHINGHHAVAGRSNGRDVRERDLTASQGAIRKNDSNTSAENAQDHGKDSFLTYFFGGASGPAGAAVSSSTAAAGLGQRASLFASEPKESDNFTAQGSTAAYGMRSLEKHLEATPLHSDELALTDRELLETSLIRSLIGSYFGIVRQSIQDLVPKAVMHLLVDHSREAIQNRLVSALFKDSLFDQLLEEDPALTGERNRVLALLQAYRKAFDGERLSGVRPSAISVFRTDTDVRTQPFPWQSYRKSPSSPDSRFPKSTHTFPHLFFLGLCVVVSLSLSLSLSHSSRSSAFFLS